MHFIQAITTVICVGHAGPLEALKEWSGQQGGVRLEAALQAPHQGLGQEPEMQTSCLQSERHLLVQDDRKSTITIQYKITAQKPDQF